MYKERNGQRTCWFSAALFGTDMDKIKILVVDDESRMRKLVHDFLAKKNYEVLEAALCL